MLRQLICSLIIFASFVFRANAQIINVDQTDTASYTHHLKAGLTVSLGAEIDKQKVTLVDATNTLDAYVQEYKELFIFSAAERFTYEEHNSFLNTGHLHLRWRYDYKNKVHPEVYVQYQWDEKIGLVRRSLIGANIRYNILKHDHLDITVATGLMYEAEEWGFDAVDSDRIPTPANDPKNYYLKSSSYLKIDIETSNNSSITAHVFYQARPDGSFFHPRIGQTLHFVVALGKHINWEIGYYGMYDERPVVPIPNYYYSISNALSVKF